MRPFSASLDCLAEDVRVLPVVIAELELGNVQREIFATDLVECPDHAALNQRPEAFNSLSVNRADYVLTARMVNARVREVFVETPVPDPLIGAEQANLRGHGLARTNSVRVAARTFSMTRATTLPLRVTAPAIAALPEPMFHRHHPACPNAGSWLCRQRKFRQPQRCP